MFCIARLNDAGDPKGTRKSFQLPVGVTKAVTSLSSGLALSCQYPESKSSVVNKS